MIMLATIIWALLTILCKCLPHTANYSPEIAMTVYLASRYSFLKASFLTIAIVEIADVGLALLYGYPAFGLWSIVNAMALLLIIAVFAPSWSKTRWFDCVARVFCASLFYWVLTNLGVWLSAQYYPMTMQGLIECYTMALPFLPAQLLSGAVFGALWTWVKYASLKSKIVHPILKPHC
jgi:hypothetical protein